MRYTIVQYKVKPENVNENTQLIRAVFQELHDKRPEGLRYVSLAHADGRFVHIVEETGAEASLTALSAFNNFRNGIHKRVLEKPQVMEVTVVGDYHMLNRADAPSR
ncbi:MAG: hypothetical protein ACXVAM_14770 [Vulcanimicrobiaceae bacterium]